jgi:flagellar export protein FliJ
MQRFHFRLERLKRVREVEEQAARERFLAADRRARDAEDAADAARCELVAAEARHCAALAERKSDPARILLELAAIDGLRADAGRTLERARTARAEAERERQAWSERRRDVRGLERLAGRDLERWRAETARREAQELDEVASVRAAARERPGASGASWESASRPMRAERT